ncbi:MAG: glutamate--tRNA ligase [Candidatus Kaelpia aquatica]|nr:glutamate--tRNA ligase [Candidatus Kaelpia aquatica]
MSEIVLRFAPSPTGYLHVGGARTALFNFLFARHNKGKFILRIEDTDLERSEDSFLDDILESLKWLGIDWDGEVIHQSQRFDIYRNYADKLLRDGLAYEEKTERGLALRYKSNADSVKFNDLLRGEIEFKEGFSDIVLMKSDGSPTYNFACVVDDATLGMTHIVRGEDHISNTPKQVLLYQLLGFKVPEFIHLPLILGEDRTRLSKRHGAVSVTAYREEGFLPQALFNFLALLGWSPGDNREILSKKELINLFSFDRINKSNAAFDVGKLKWMNKKYLKQVKDSDYRDTLIKFIQKENLLDQYNSIDEPKREMLFKLLKPRSSTYAEYAQQLRYILSRGYVIDEASIEKYDLKSDKSKEIFKDMALGLKSLDEFSFKEIEEVIRATASKFKLEAKEVIHPLRVILTGNEISPPLFELMEILGREEVLARIENFL